MDGQRRSNLALGVVLILLGGVFLATQLFPGLGLALSWPWIVIGVGAALLVIGLLVGAPDMAVPACIVGGIGGILYYQNSTGKLDQLVLHVGFDPGFRGGWHAGGRAAGRAQPLCLP